MTTPLTRTGLRTPEPWARAGIRLPAFDLDAMALRTRKAPRWVHFGAGNIFRGFLAACCQELLEAGLTDTGIVVAEAHDEEIIDTIYRNHDNLVLNVAAAADGSLAAEVVASIAEGLVGDPARPEDWRRLLTVFEQPSLQLASFTITEKGYAVAAAGVLNEAARDDVRCGPGAPVHAMSKVAALMLRRYAAGAWPIALVSMDNCSHNGDKLRAAVLAISQGWLANGFVDAGFLGYLEDPSKVAFPWTMIDKITPRPSEEVRKGLEAAGIAGLGIVVTGKHTWIAPFVNAEASQYLFIEDAFPNGRPPLERARGVWFTDRATVNRVETMKVTTCLNPLHTAIALTGRLLGREMVFEAMKDKTIARLVHRIGYVEGLPVVVDPGVIKPFDFINDVVQNRFPNPVIPDTTSRIASDTSQKMGIRYGETIKAYASREDLEVRDLVGIPLVIAAWLRYLLGVDDAGQPMAVSPDPMQAELTGLLAGCALGGPSADLAPILGNAAIFGSDLNRIGLGHRIQAMFDQMIQGRGAVRATLDRHLAEAE